MRGGSQNGKRPGSRRPRHGIGWSKTQAAVVRWENWPVRAFKLCRPEGWDDQAMGEARYVLEMHTDAQTSCEADI